MQLRSLLQNDGRLNHTNKTSNGYDHLYAKFCEDRATDITNKTMYLFRNTVQRSRNHCCSRNATMYFVFLPHCHINGTIFEKKKLIHYHILSLMCNGLHVRYTPFLSHFNEIWHFSTDFDELWNIKFRANPCNRSRVASYGDMTEIIGAFRKNVYAPEVLAIYKI